MVQMKVPIDTMASISVFSRGGAAAQFNRVENSRPVTVLRNNKPEYVIMTVDDYKRIGELEEEVRELRNAEARRQARNHEYTHQFNTIDSFKEYLDAI